MVGRCPLLLQVVGWFVIQVPLPGAAGGAASSAGTGAVAVAAWSSEQELLAYLKDASAMEAGGGEEGELPLLRLCISRGWFAAARDVVSRAHGRLSGGSGGGASSLPSAAFAPIRDEVSRLLSELKRQADDFGAFADATYRGQTAGLDEVACAVQWAQNSTTVFVGVKYAARWSAPGAIEVVDIDVNITDNAFALSGYGHHSSIRKRYMVDLELFGAVVPNQSSWSTASVGRMTATFRKAAPGPWPRLVKIKEKTRHPITKWLDMQERWAVELENFTEAARKAARQSNAEKKAKPNGVQKEDKHKDKDRNKSDQDFLLPLKRLLKRWYRRLPSRLRKKIGTWEDALRLTGNLCLVLGLLTFLRYRWQHGSSKRGAVACSPTLRQSREEIAKLAEQRVAAPSQVAE